jgi:hypothetical protein
MPGISQYPRAVHPERNQKRDVANLFRRAPVEDDPVAIAIRVLALHGPVPPSLERPVNRLVQLGYGRRRPSRATAGVVLAPAAAPHQPWSAGCARSGEK